MQNSLIKKIKIFVVVALVVIVAGMTMFGVFGFNQAVDYNGSYELQVSVDQNAGKSIEVLKTSSEKAIKDNGLTAVSVQTLNDGALLIYKFNTNVADKTDAILSSIQSALDSQSQVTGIKANVEVKQNHGYVSGQTVKLLIALAIGVLLTFVFSLFMSKLAGACATVSSAIIAGLVTFALIALTRLPIENGLATSVAISMIISSCLSILLSVNYTKTAKDVKLPSFEIAQIVNKSCVTSVVFAIIAIVLVCAMIFALSQMTVLYTVLRFLLSSVVGITVACFIAPLVWSAVKKN